VFNYILGKQASLATFSTKGATFSKKEATFSTEEVSLSLPFSAKEYSPEICPLFYDHLSFIFFPFLFRGFPLISCNLYVKSKAVPIACLEGL
jgi:hypothetical protein